MAVIERNMALTEIAKKLKETFPGFEVSGFQEELKKFKEIYREAETIRIGEMDYIVINDVYKSDEYKDVPESTSPLFYSSINNNYAIIDAETSSTLIDEVYSRVTYMQRDCETTARIPEKDEIKHSMRSLIGENEKVIEPQIESDDDDGKGGLSRNKANIFQCQLIKDTGVSAAPDVYSFMLKGGEIKEVADSAIRQIRSGTVKMLNDSNIEELKSNESAIQEAVFNKYINSDIDIQSVTVKSIFEIRMAFCNIHLLMQSVLGKTKINSIFNTYYMASENNEFEALNANIHLCNCCNHDLVDVRDENKIYRLHANLDAYDEKATQDANGKEAKGKKGFFEKVVYAVGCEDCLEECPECHGWHFNYQKLIGSKIYDKVNLMPGRSFIRNLRDFDMNYCSCRENIDWVYDEKSGTADEHDVLPITEMAFINYAGEKMADYNDYISFYNSEKKHANIKDAMDEKNFAKKTLNKFKLRLSDTFHMDIDGILVSSNERCHKCNVCGGEYYGYLENDRCRICQEMFGENHHMVTRADGVVFLRSGSDSNRVINKYVITRFGNLKKISSKSVGSANKKPAAQPKVSLGNVGQQMSVSGSDVKPTPPPPAPKKQKNNTPAKKKK